MTPKHPSQKRYPPVSRQLGVSNEALRAWDKQAEIEGGLRPEIAYSSALEAESEESPEGPA